MSAACIDVDCDAAIASKLGSHMDMRWTQILCPPDPLWERACSR
jgi:hypothetical protein